MIAFEAVVGSGKETVNVPLVQVFVPLKSKTTHNLSLALVLKIAPKATLIVADDHTESAKSQDATAVVETGGLAVVGGLVGGACSC